MNLLLCSSSGYKDTPYLTHLTESFEEFIKGLSVVPTSAVFIPYAGITKTHDEYVTLIKPFFTSVGITTIKGIHEFENPQKGLQDAEMILVGGGNTFVLLKTLQEQGLIPIIQQRVAQGIPYMGWSAGSNVSGMSIHTTNDMPIVEPLHFNANQLVPFCINPHFISGQIAGHNGESREQRLKEFMIMNPTTRVVALYEGSALIRHDKHLRLVGKNDQALLFLNGKITPIEKGSNDQLLLPSPTEDVPQVDQITQ